MINDENISKGRNMLGSSYFERIKLLVVQNFQKLTAIIGLIYQFEIERLDELRRKVGAEQLYSMKLIEVLSLGGELINGITRNGHKSNALSFHIVDYYKI
jgi:hypothetical protein